MHEAAYRYVLDQIAGNHYNRVVEVGGRDINGSVRLLFTADEYLSIDLEDGKNVDVVGDCRQWVPPYEADLVVCCEVLEHAPDPAGVVAACIRYLAPGGLLVLTCAGPGRLPHSGHDGGAPRAGEWYANISPGWLRRQLKALDDAVVTFNPVACDTYATALKPS